MEENDSKLRVADALLPSKYRVYPDTPIAEVVDLMVRRGLRALPVVGEQFEVLGILTSGDALAYMLSWGRPGDEEPTSDEGPIARDVMTRSVLCVSEEQALPEAANVMVNRDVEQLAVVKEGEFIGFITRDSVLRKLCGVPESEDDHEETTT